MRAYPWTPSEFLIRSEEIIREAKRQMVSCSDSLEIRLSQIAVACLGVFAKKDIIKGEKILDCRCATGTSNSPTTGRHCYNCARNLESARTPHCAQCQSIIFCSEECKALAEQNYHAAICGRDFSSLYGSVQGTAIKERSNARVTQSFLRLIAIFVQAGEHPPRHFSVASLTANYKSEPIPWSYGGHIFGPHKVMEELVIDIFVNEDFDTWVLQSIWY